MNALLLALVLCGQGTFIVRDTLPNGLVVVAARKEGLPLFRALLAFRAGALYDPAGKAGTAYILKDLFQQGPEGMTSTELAYAIEGLGGEIGSRVSYNDLRISLGVLSPHADSALSILARVVSKPALRPEDFQKLKRRALSRLQQVYSDPNRVVSRHFRRALYGEHPLGRPIEGDESSLEALTLEDVRDFYERFCYPNNAVLIIVSDIEQSKVIEMVRRHFGEWAPGKVKIPEIPSPRPVEGKYVEIIDMDVNQSYISLGHLGLRRSDPDYNGVRIMNYILGGGAFASRFFKIVRNEKGLAYSAYSYFEAGSKFPGYFIAHLETSVDNTNDAVGLVLNLIRDMKRKGVKKEELDDARAYFKGSLPRMTETYDRLADAILFGELQGLPDMYWEKDVEEIQKMDVDYVNEMARKYLDPENFVLVIVSDTSKLRLEIPGISPEEVHYGEIR
ncbi:MAG TPA: insulinase family protein [candidate division WOR-3 bacterium]|uniref:Insulinase family protein n=1 Tax=candidate division WOR-3 bacterium TaxID=2052148 RepID=A0A7C1BFJ7_UNCW3|nr:insulinase family protein [candidate division WOR-3 bacterium]